MQGLRRTRYFLQLEAIFEGGLACDPAALATEPASIIVLCFTNRSGSNYLAALLASTGRVRSRGEALLAEVLGTWRDALAVTTFQPVFNEIILPAQRGRRQKASCFKAGANQLSAIDELGYLDALGDRVRYLHVSREDVLGQAISFEIAAQTLAWTSRHEPASEQVVFDRDAIERRLASIERANATFDALFTRRGVVPCRVVYERLMAKPEAEIERIGRELGLGPLVPRLDRVPIERQEDPRKAEFRHRFLAGAA